MLVMFIPVVIVDINSEGGDRLDRAMNIGYQVQELQQEKREGDWSRAKANRVRELSNSYDRASGSFARCVENYKRELKARYRNGEISREEMAEYEKTIRDITERV